MLFHNGFIGQNTNGFGTMINAFTFIEQNIPVESNGDFLTFKIAFAPVSRRRNFTKSL